ncbi:MAG: hypothetical protein DME42_06785 [Verrucomicrobia bacterium]|nr:MAG: hypothetical protein DME42_06785 [Verrucomicrobiota bacterium]
MDAPVLTPLSHLEGVTGRSSPPLSIAETTRVFQMRELAQQGYYRGGIDGILGPETSRAIMRFQSNQGLRVTGVLTRDTVEALGLRQVASTNEEPTYD